MSQKRCNTSTSKNKGVSGPKIRNMKNDNSLGSKTMGTGRLSTKKKRNCGCGNKIRKTQ